MVLRSLGDMTSQKVQQDVLGSFDTDANNRITFAEFVRVMAIRLTESSDNERDILEAFRVGGPTRPIVHDRNCPPLQVFDRNHDGKISVAELTAVMQTLGQPHISGRYLVFI
jgi:Ca2+-binding EF-hand superfamily protein